MNIKSGFISFDNKISLGLNQIHAFYGDKKCGKTLLSLGIAIEIAKNNKQKIQYIHCEPEIKKK